MNAPTRGARCRFVWEVLERDVLEKYEAHSPESLSSLLIALLVVLTKGVQDHGLESLTGFVEQVWLAHAEAPRTALTDAEVKVLARRKLRGKIALLLLEGPNQFASGLVGLLVLVSFQDVDWPTLKTAIEDTWNSEPATALLERLQQYEATRSELGLESKS